MEEEEIKNIALEVDNVSNNIGENQIKKVIYVKDKLINFVI
jgi:leucyl-tRNA synthetase